MNWRAEAEEKLRKYDILCRAVTNIPLEIERLEQEARSLSGGSCEIKSSKRSVRSREERLMNNIVSRQELQLSLDQARQWVQAATRALSCLSRQERLVLHRFYISPQEGVVERLCDELGVEKSSVYRRRDKALEKFTLAMYGATESN